MVEFESIYGDLILQYIKFKRSLGYKYNNAEIRFRVFDRFAVQENCSQVGLTKSLFEKWMEPKDNEQESSRYRRVNELINFSRVIVFAKSFIRLSSFASIVCVLSTPTARI